MANTKSAIKAARKAAMRRLRNKMWKSMIKTALRRVREAVAAGVEDLQPLVSRAYKIIDRAAAKGVIHRNTAARKKSRLMKFLASAGKTA